MTAYQNSGIVSKYTRPTGEEVVIAFDRESKTMTVTLDGEEVRSERIPRIGFCARVDWAYAYRTADLAAYKQLTEAL